MKSGSVRDRVLIRGTAAQLYPVALVVSSTTAVAVGFIFSFLPYLLWWERTGHFAYIADLDNEYYLQLASHVYHHGAFLMSDVVIPNGATMYQSLLFVPAVLLVRALGLTPLEVNTVWHLVTAIAMPLLFYVVFLRWLHRPWAAVCCTIVMLVDCGVLTVEPFVAQLLHAYQVLAGHLPPLYDGQDLLTQWRVVDPAVGMPFLLLQIVLVSAAVEQPQGSKLRLAAGICTGVLFYIWFYYWTAAVIALLIAFVLDRAARRTYAGILGICLVAGAPAIAEGLITKALLNPEALTRIGVFAPVPRLAFFLLPKAGLLALVITGLWVWRRPGHEGSYLWCLGLAALILSNNHLVSGMDLRAGHWRFVWGTALTTLVLVMASHFLIDGLPISRLAIAALTSAVLTIEVTTGLTLRTIEVDRSINTNRVLNRYIRFVSQVPTKTLASLTAGSVIAGDKDFCDLASIMSDARPLAGYAAFLSLDLNDQQWETREALNAHLEGLSGPQFRREARNYAGLYGWGQSDNIVGRRLVETGMIREFLRMEHEFQPETDRFDVGYVALLADQNRPAYLRNGWSLMETGPHWQIWKRDKGFDLKDSRVEKNRAFHSGG